MPSPPTPAGRIAPSGSQPRAASGSGSHDLQHAAADFPRLIAVRVSEVDSAVAAGAAHSVCNHWSLVPGGSDLDASLVSTSANWPGAASHGGGGEMGDTTLVTEVICDDVPDPLSSWPHPLSRSHFELASNRGGVDANIHVDPNVDTSNYFEVASNSGGVDDTADYFIRRDAVPQPPMYAMSAASSSNAELAYAPAAVARLTGRRLQ